MVSYVQPFPGCEILARNDTIRATERKKIKVDLLKNDYVSSGLPVLQKAGGGAAQVGDVIAQKKTAYGVLKLVLTADGKVEFVPGPAFDALKAGQVFKTKFTYTIADASGQLSTATINLSVKGVNNGPAVTALATSNQGQVIEAVDASNQDIRPITGNFLVRDLDRGDRLVGVINKVDVSYSGGVALPAGVQAALGNPAAFSVEPVTANGRSQVMRWTYDPAALNLDFLKAGETITVAFSVAVSDSRSNGATQVVRFTIVGTNDAPVANDDTFSILEDAPLVLDAASLVGNDTDLDRGEGGTALTITGVNAVNGGTVALVNGQVVFTPAANFNGVATFTYTISDGKGGTDTGTVTVNVAAVNDAPLAVDDLATTEEDTAVSIDVLGNDTDVDGPALSIKAGSVAVVGGAAVGTAAIVDGKIVFTPATNYTGQATITYVATDSTADSNPASVTINVTPVNDAPDLSKFVLPAQQSPEDQTITVTTATLQAILAGPAFDVDNTNAQLDYVIVVKDGAVAIATIPVDGANPQGFTFTPPANFNGPLTVEVTATDPGGKSDTKSFGLTITPVNDAPAGTDGPVTVAEEGTYTFVAGDFGFTDPVDAGSQSGANQLLAVKITTLPGGGSLALNGVAVTAGQVVSLADITAGKLKFTGALNVATDQSFTFQVQDNGGTANGGVDLDPTPNTITINVTPVNDAPVAANDVGTVLEGSFVQIGVLGNDSDVDGPLTPASITAFTNGQHGSVSQNLDGTFTYVHNGSETTSDSFTYTITDSSGASSTATVTLTVTPVNDSAQLTPVLKVLQETNAPLTTSGVLGITDVDSPETFVPQTNTAGTYGKFSLNANGSWTFTANAAFDELNVGQSYTDVFEVQSADGTKTTVTIKIVGTADNSPPDAVNDFYNIAPLLPVTLNVVSNDTDPDGSAGLQLTSIGTTTNGGTVAIVNGAVVYTPKEVFQSYTDTFTYTITDAAGLTDVATVTVNVDPTLVPTTSGAVYASKLTDNVTLSAKVLLANDGIATNDGAKVIDAVVIDPDYKDIEVAFDPETQTLVFDTAGFAASQNKGFISLRFEGGGYVNYELVYVQASDGETLTGEYVASYLNAGNGPDDLIGSTTITGQGGADYFVGLAGDDRLRGVDGNDTLIGGGGRDTIEGGAGADILTGDGQADVFEFKSPKHSEPGNGKFDTITDFVTGTDKIDLFDIDAKTQSGFAGDQAFEFVAAQSTGVTANKITWYQDGTNTFIQADTDGNTTTVELFIKLSGLKSLTATDFIL